MRAIRNHQYLLIWNLRPDRWPAGTPNYKLANIPSCWLGDCDNGPTKTYLVEHKDDNQECQKYFDLSFGKRPEFELYDCKLDPGQLENLAYQPAYAKIREALLKTLKTELQATEDPRSLGGAIELFEETKYFGQGPRHPSFRREKEVDSSCTCINQTIFFSAQSGAVEQPFSDEALDCTLPLTTTVTKTISSRIFLRSPKKMRR